MGYDNDQRMRAVIDRVMADDDGDQPDDNDDGLPAELRAELARGRELLARLDAIDKARRGDPDSDVRAPLAGGLNPDGIGEDDDRLRSEFDRYAEMKRHLRAVHGGATW